MKQRERMVLTVVVIVVFLMVSISASSFHQVENSKMIRLANQDVGNWRISVEITNLEESNYRGNLKVYVVEPISRWGEVNGKPYPFALLDFAYDKDIEVSDSIIKEISWNPYPIGNVEADNLMVIAVLFNEHSEVRYSSPTHQQRPFDSYFTDATAATTPDNIGYNQVTEDFTHTVFIEKGSASGCSPCSKASEALSNIYSSTDYPFYYVNLVSDRSNIAQARLRRAFNIGSYPTLYFDGGYQVQVGTPQNIEQTFRSLIEISGQRNVPRLSLSVSMTWDPDSTPPMVTITKPNSGLYIINDKKRNLPETIVVGAIDIKVDASDEDTDIEKVEFYVDNQLRSVDMFYPYKLVNWKEPGLFGRYTIRAVAYDQAGNVNIDEIEVIRLF